MNHTLRIPGGPVAAGLVLVVVATSAISAAAPELSPAGRPGAASADPSPVSSPVPTPTARLSEAEAEALNRRLLVAALGPDFRVALSEGRPPFEYVQLVPGSASARTIPKGYVAEAVVTVTDESDLTEACDEEAGTDVICARRTPPEGRDILVRTSTPTTREIPSVAAENIYLPRADGHVVRTAVFARGDFLGRVFTVPKAALARWLHGFDDALIAAATDPRITAAPSP